MGKRWVLINLFATIALSEIARGALPQRPNIVLIMADDLGCGELGPYGQALIKTPQIDALATEGLLFTSFYAGATVCTPSRASLLTGMHGGRASLRDINESAHLQTCDITIPELLRSAGYYSACVGKWHTGSFDSAGHPILQGFDEFWGMCDDLYPVEPSLHYPTKLYSDFKSLGYPENKGSMATFSHDLFTDAALAVISRRAQQDPPFFLFLNYYVPHRHLDPVPAPPADPSDPLHHATYESESWSDLAKHKAEMISRFDRDVGRIVERIDSLGIGSNTVLLVTSDNGPALNDGVGPETPFNSNGPCRSGKTSLYDGGIREPMIVRWAGHVATNSVSAQAGSFADLLPTFADLAGLAARVPADVTGVSLLPVLEDPSSTVAPGDLYWQRRPKTNTIQERRAARFGDWKIVEPSSGAARLFNLASDPGETTDVSSANIAEYSEGIALLDQLEFRSVTRASGVVGCWPFDEHAGNMALDTTGNAHAQPDRGAIAWTDDMPGIDDGAGFQNGGAIVFNGSADRLSTGYPGVGGDESRTISLWIKTTTAATTQKIISWGKPDCEGLYWEIGLNAAGEPAVDIAGGAVRADGVNLADGNWHHLAVVLDSAALGDTIFYVDGKTQSTAGDLAASVDTEIFDGSWAPGGASQGVIIGGNASAGFIGKLDDLLIFNQALDGSAVAALRASGGLARSRPLEGRIDLSDGSVTLINHGDSSIQVCGYNIVSRSGDLQPGNLASRFPAAPEGYYLPRSACIVGDADFGGSGIALAPAAKLPLGELLRADAGAELENTQLTVDLGDGSQRTAWLTLTGAPPELPRWEGPREPNTLSIANGDFEIASNPSGNNYATVDAWKEESAANAFIQDTSLSGWYPEETRLAYFTDQAGTAINQDLDHRWKASDRYILRFTATEAGFRSAPSETGDAIRVQIRQTDGTVLWDSGMIDMDGTLSGDTQGAVFWGAAQRDFAFEIDASSFIPGKEGSQINLRIARAGGAVYFDDLRLDLSEPLPGLEISGFGAGKLDLPARPSTSSWRTPPQPEPEGKQGKQI